MKSLLRVCKRGVATTLKTLITKTPLPIGVQAWAIKSLLPMDPWPKSLAYQQCLADRILAQLGSVSQAGPFKGMQCISDAEEGCLVPKLLGCYEEELAPVIESLLERDYDRVVDVGCASGYWLTGLAMRLPRAELYGFDTDETARKRCEDLLSLNNVQSRVKMSGLCTPADFENLIQGRTLLFVDCDGPEYELLDPRNAPALRRADIIVECHDFLNPKITPTLLERFGDSHSIETVTSRERQPSLEAYPGLRVLPREHWSEALAERRPTTQNWLIMRSRHLPANKASATVLAASAGREIGAPVSTACTKSLQA